MTIAAVPFLYANYVTTVGRHKRECIVLYSEKHVMSSVLQAMQLISQKLILCVTEFLTFYP